MKFSQQVGRARELGAPRRAGIISGKYERGPGYTAAIAQEIRRREESQRLRSEEGVTVLELVVGMVVLVVVVALGATLFTHNTALNNEIAQGTTIFLLMSALGLRWWGITSKKQGGNGSVEGNPEGTGEPKP